MLANKEALVMSGQLFIDAVINHDATLLPIDSEHNAIFQCLPFSHKRFPHQHGVSKVLLTASGGPFLHRPVDTLDSVTPEQAIAHPKWVMGRKISVDSATMMNKGLEVIEAHWLFGIPQARLKWSFTPKASFIQWFPILTVRSLHSLEIRICGFRLPMRSLILTG